MLSTYAESCSHEGRSTQTAELEAECLGTERHLEATHRPITDSLPTYYADPIPVRTAEGEGSVQKGEMAVLPANGIELLGSSPPVCMVVPGDIIRHGVFRPPRLTSGLKSLQSAFSSASL